MRKSHHTLVDVIRLTICLGMMWPSLAQAETPAGSGNLLVWLGVPSAIAVAVYAALTFLAPEIVKEMRDRATARREFIKAVTADVVKLANTHYWALANAAGTTGDLLGEHLNAVQAHLALTYTLGTPEQNRDGLKTTLARVCTEAANQSFPSLVRLIVLFDRFQFRGSQTYLLPNHTAGVALRQLYNQFAGALPEDGFVSNIRRAVEKHLAEEAKPPSGEPAPGLAGLILDDERLDKLHLNQARDAYAQWLCENLLSVSEAADALRAYAELLSHELANLNRVFFRDRGRVRSTGAFGVDTVASGTWPQTLSEASLFTLARAGRQSEFYRPLGGLASALPSSGEPRKNRQPPGSNTGTGQPPPTTVR